MNHDFIICDKSSKSYFAVCVLIYDIYCVYYAHILQRVIVLFVNRTGLCYAFVIFAMKTIDATYLFICINAYIEGKPKMLGNKVTFLANRI